MAFQGDDIFDGIVSNCHEIHLVLLSNVTLCYVILCHVALGYVTLFYVMFEF